MSYTLNNIVRGLNPNDAARYVVSYLREQNNYSTDDAFSIYDIYSITELDTENMFKLAFSVYTVPVDDSERMHYAFFYISLFLYMMTEFNKENIDYILTQVNLRAVSERFINKEELSHFDYEISELIHEYYTGLIMGVTPSDETFTDFLKTAISSGSYSIFVPNNAKQEFISLVNTWRTELANATYNISKFVAGYIYNYDFVENAVYYLMEVLDNGIVEEGIYSLDGRSLDGEKLEEYLYDYYLISQNLDINSIARKDKTYEFSNMMENDIREILKTKYNLIGV